MKKFLLSLLAIMMIFAFVACENPAGGKGDTGTNQNTTTDTNTENNTGDAEAVVKECTVDIDSFAPSAGTWKLQRIEFEGGAEFNKVYNIEIGGTESDSSVKIECIYSDFVLRADNDERYNQMKANYQNLTDGVKAIFDDVNRVIIVYTENRDGLKNLDKDFTYAEFIVEYPFSKTNADKTKYIANHERENYGSKIIEQDLLIKR